MELFSILANGLKALAGAISPFIKKKYFDQPKVYIKLSGQGCSFVPTSKPYDPYLNPEYMINTPQLVNSACWRTLHFINNSEYPAYNFRVIIGLENSIYNVTPAIDSLSSLNINSENKYAIETHYQFERMSNEAKNEYPEPESIAGMKLILEYTNVRGTKFFTVFDNSKGSDAKNQFSRRLP